jgi:hypothetical protein
LKKTSKGTCCKRTSEGVSIEGAAWEVVRRRRSQAAGLVSSDRNTQIRNRKGLVNFEQQT